MRAGFYEQNGSAREVLKLGEIATPRPGPGEVRVRLATSGVNPSDVKARSGSTRKIAYPRVVPHSDGAGEIDTLLIAGGAGAVGHHAVQFAKAAGATVITTVSSAEKAAAARAAGADHAIDYKRDNVGERVMALTGKKGVDAIIELDIAANARLIPQVLRPRGLVVVYGTGAAEAAIPLMYCLRYAITLKFIYVYELDTAERAAAIAGIERAITAGTLATNIGATFALADVVDAHEAVEHGKLLGNVVVRIR
jgi:NADPH2:quinone reductase